MYTDRRKIINEEKILLNQNYNNNNEKKKNYNKIKVFINTKFKFFFFLVKKLIYLFNNFFSF